MGAGGRDQADRHQPVADRNSHGRWLRLWLATGRGVMKIGDLHVVAAAMSEFVYDELESRLLLAIRRMNVRKRQVVVEMVQGLMR